MRDVYLHFIHGTFTHHFEHVIPVLSHNDMIAWQRNITYVRIVCLTCHTYIPRFKYDNSAQTITIFEAEHTGNTEMILYVYLQR